MTEKGREPDPMRATITLGVVLLVIVALLAWRYEQAQRCEGEMVNTMTGWKCVPAIPPGKGDK